MVVAPSDLLLVQVDGFEGESSFQTVVIFREHVGGVNIHEPIIVKIGNVPTHGGEADVPNHPLQFFLEGTVVIVYIEIVSLEKIVGHINVRPAVIVDISDRHAQSEPDDAPVDARGSADIHESSVIITVESVPAVRIPCMAQIL